MDRALVALILAGLLAATTASYFALHWLLDQTARAIAHLWRSR